MITATEAKGLSSVPILIAEIEKQVIEAAKAGFPGIWIDRELSFPARNILQGCGYDLSTGNTGKDAYEDGICRKGQTWIYWGY